MHPRLNDKERNSMEQVRLPNGKIDNIENWDLNSAKSNCKDCHGRGWVTIYDKTIKRKLICVCVARKTLSSGKVG